MIDMHPLHIVCRLGWLKKITAALSVLRCILNIHRRGPAIRLINIDLNLLTTLALLLQTRSVSATARKIGISQPTASRSLSRLREIFGDPLLIRTNAGMELTRRAEELMEPLREWLAQTDSLLIQSDFEPSGLKRRFRIASTDFGVISVVAPALARLNQEAPDATIDVVPFTDNMFAKLTSGELDCIISGLDPDNSIIYSRHLFRMSSTCVMRAEHPLACETTDEISIDQFLQWPHIGILVGEHGFDRIAQFLGDRATERRIIATLPYFQAAHSMLVQSDALMVVPTPATPPFRNDPQFALRTPPASIPPLDYWVLWHERNRRDPAIMWLCDLFADSVRAA